MASQFDETAKNHLNFETVIKESSDYFGKSLRVIDSRSVANQYYTHFRATYNGSNRPTEVTYYRGTTAHITTVNTTSAASLNNKYFYIYDCPNDNKYTIWFNVDSAGSAPVVSDTYEYIEVALQGSDTSSVVAAAIRIILNGQFPTFFSANTNGNEVVINNQGLGLTQDSSAGNSGFVVQNTIGTQETIKTIVIEYSGTNPIYNGQELKDYSFDIYSGKFYKVQDDVVIGNENGTADFGAGATTSQTLRTASNTYGSDPNGTISLNKESGTVTSNTTTTPLLAGATWNGTWTEASQYSCVSFTIQTNVDSAANGVRVQYSHDGTNIIRQSVATQTGSSNGVFYSLPIHAKYFRLFFQNGAVNQTTFNVDCQLHEEFNGLAAVPLNLPLVDTVTATAVKAVISGKSVDGFYTNQRADGASTVNSTTTLLTAGQTFTGPFEDIIGFANISITAFSDVASATDGLRFEYSTDGVNVDDFDSFTLSAGNGGQFSSGATTKYFRVKYTNGSSNQTTFRLQTIYHITAPKSSTHRIDDAINGENDAELNKAVITGRNPDGIFDNVGTSGVVSSNSSTTPLGIGGIFLGSYFDTSRHTSVSFACVTDQNGTIDIETSDDASTIIRTTTVAITANVPFYISQTPIGRYLRLRFTNTSGVDQTSFRLQTLMKMTTISPTAVTINTPLTSNSVALNSRSILSGQQENGTFTNVGLSNTASIKVAITDRPSEVRNRVKVEKQIFNTTLTGTPTVVHTVTGGKTLYLESMVISALNTANVVGEWRISDNATDKIGYLIPDKTSGSPASAASASPALPEPIPFTTNLSVRSLTGTIALSFYFIGYEE